MPLAGAGAPIDTLDSRAADGTLLTSVDVAHAATHYGHPHICLPRSRLLDGLAAGLPAGLLAFGRTCTGARQDAGRVSATFADGTDVPTALRAFERTRSRPAGLVARQAGREDYNRYGALLTRLVPDRLASGYYTRWLGRVSTYLAGPAR